MIPTRQILGIQFFNGNVEEATSLMLQRGGLLVAPSGTCFARLRDDEKYRRAVLAADLAIADSGLMVGLWRLLRRQNVQRISGLKYLKHLLGRLKGEGKRDVFWVLPTERAEEKLLDWSRGARHHRDRQRRTGKAWVLSAGKSVVSASDPLHRRGPGIHHWRSDFNSRLGGPVLSRLVVAISCPAADLHPTIGPRFGTAMVNFEIR
jgi:hypothetical protein